MQHARKVWPNLMSDSTGVAIAFFVCGTGLAVFFAGLHLWTIHDRIKELVGLYRLRCQQEDDNLVALGQMSIETRNERANYRNEI